MRDDVARSEVGEYAREWERESRQRTPRRNGVAVFRPHRGKNVNKKKWWSQVGVC